MNLSQKGLDLIKRFEGLRLVAYKVLPTEKYYTIGYGHYGSDVRQAQRISEQEAEQLLKHDVSSFVKGVNDLIKVSVNQNQFDSLVSFAYNVGLGAFGKSTLLDKLNKNDYIGASNEFPRWNKSGGKVLQGLVNRRKVEQELFDTPVQVVKPVVTKVINNIKVLGNIQIDGVKNFTYIYDKPNDQTKRLGEAKKNQVFPIAGSVTDWYEVIYQNRRAYIKAKYCSRI